MVDTYDRAVVLVLEHQRASTAWLQRQLRLGYNEAARLIERMQAEGYIGPPDAVGRREVLRPPSATLPGASVVVTPDVPAWERNAGKYDRASSATPEPATDRPRLRVVAPPPAPPSAIDLIDGMFDDEARLPDRPVETIAAELVATLGLEGARRTVRAAAERGALLDAPPDPDRVSAAHLTQIVERARTLFGERAEIAEDIRSLFKFAKEIGFDPPTIRACIKALEADKDQRWQKEALLTIYRHALGIEDPDFALPLPTPSVPPPQKARKLTAKEKAYQETLAAVAASQTLLLQ